MKREDVEALLAYVEMKIQSNTVELPPTVTDETLAALCRAWLAVQDAPAGEVVQVGDDDEGQPRAIVHSTRNQLAKQPPILFKRVRIVAEGAE